MDGVRIADLEQPRRPRIRCRYSDEALRRAPLNSPILSCSLPLGDRPADAAAFCRGLLPEGQALQALAARAGVAVNATFDLLARCGRDVAGALVIDADDAGQGRLAAARRPTSSRSTTRDTPAWSKPSRTASHWPGPPA